MKKNTIKTVFMAMLLLTFMSVGFAEKQELNFKNISTTKGLLTVLTDRFDTYDTDIANLQSSANLGTGNVYYVDSGKSNAATVDGTKPEWALPTLDAAVAKCTANNGDIIYVMQGHTENLSGADGVDLDVAGIAVIGLGEGTDAPEFVYTNAAGEFVIGAASVTISNLRFVPSVTGITHAIDVENAGDYATIVNCKFVDGEAAGTDEFNAGITIQTTATDCTIAKCDYFCTGAPNCFISLETATIVNPTIYGNVIYGTFAQAGIYAATTVPTNVYVGFNTVTNLSSGQFAIEFGGAATGVCEYNRMYTDAEATSLDPGSMSCIENYVTTAIDASAVIFPAEDDTVQNFIGVNDSDNAAVTSSVASNRDGSILERMEFIAKYLETGTPGALVAPANTFSILDILGSDGSTTTGAVAGSILGAVGTNEAASATPFTSAAVEDDPDGSVLEREEHIAADTDKIDAVTLSTTPVAASLASFIASGGTALGSQLATSKSLVDAIGSNGTTLADTATSIGGVIGVPTDADNVVSSATITSNPDGSVLERQEYMQKLQEVLTAEQLRSIAGSAMPLAVWYVDPAAAGTADGKSPANAFTTIGAALTACNNAVDDWVLIFDYSGGGGTIQITKSFVHLIGMGMKGMPYPRIKPATAVVGIQLEDSADRVEIANLVIGGGDQTVAAIDFNSPGGAYGCYIHDCVIGRDADAPGNDGIAITSGKDAPYLVVENCTFYGATMSGLDQSGIEIAGNCTGGSIIGCYFQDIGSSTNPAINLSGTVGNMRIEGNRIAGTDDTGAGWGITLSANCTNIFVDGNHAASSDAAGDTSAFVDSAADEANAWGINYTDITADLP